MPTVLKNFARLIAAALGAEILTSHSVRHGPPDEARRCSMNCPDCVRLEAERARCVHALAVAISIMNAAASGDDGGEYLRLRAVANEARLDLNLVLTELMPHQDRHAVPN